MLVDVRVASQRRGGERRRERVYPVRACWGHPVQTGYGAEVALASENGVRDGRDCDVGGASQDGGALIWRGCQALW